ncbi:hypothetical protein [Stenotrophomonas ginsengisoli]|uniref:hypothetical protein n=1 Tax=Stenotrophomonas ginsengisoli TaxID=336566 RepID=UPI00128EB379|nr:hypothetical protein [Stenotrophomonas ginsengisoli]
MSCLPFREELFVSNVKVEENGRSAAFLNPDRLRFFRIKFDGGIVKNTIGADFVVVKDGVGSVVVELKGTDIEHAVDQIDATIGYVKSCKAPASNGKIEISALPVAGLIVCSRFPRASTTFQKRQKRFVSKHRSPLHCVSGKFEGLIEYVLKF